MEEENTEELYIDNMLANYMESDFYLANPQQAFPGSMELLKSPDIWIGDTIKSHYLQQGGWKEWEKILHIYPWNYGRCVPTRQGS